MPPWLEIVTNYINMTIVLLHPELNLKYDQFIFERFYWYNPRSPQFEIATT